MAKKTILITGSTNGMGKAAALVLARQGNKIILVGRDPVMTKKVQQEIIRESGNPDIDYFIADLFLLADVRKLADDFAAKYDHLDVLINNAGAMMGKEREETAEGIEKTIALNFLAPILLSELLLNSLKKGKNPRIVNTASVAHKLMAKPNFLDVELKTGYTASRAYGNAKLFLIMASLAMSRKLEGSITVNTLHPGVVINNGMIEGAKKRGFLGKAIMLPLLRLLMKTPEQGADTIVYLASSDEIKSTTGVYFSNRRPAKVGRKYITEESRDMVWNYFKRKAAAMIEID